MRFLNRNDLSSSSSCENLSSVLQLQVLITLLFINAVSISTLGRISGVLDPLAVVGGLLLICVTTWAFFSYARLLRQESGGKWFSLFTAALFFQIFWAFFKSPLDVDGLGYHLPIVLEPLQNGQWGHWSFSDWRIQTFPKFGELPHLCLIAFGNILPGHLGHRLTQFGQFSSVIAGVLACTHLARNSGSTKPTIFGLLFFLTPIVIKQMGSHSVDVASWSYWLTAAAFLTVPKQVPSLVRSKIFYAGFACFLHAGTKTSGSLTALALIPLVPRCELILFLSFLIMGAVSWVLPNYLSWGNPVYPINFSITPNFVGVGSDFHATFNRSGIPKFIRWLSQFFLFEPIAVYDMNDGAWGFVGLWSILVFFVHFRDYFKKISLKNRTTLVFICMALAFFLMPSRIIPRHGLLGGFLFIGPAVYLLLQGRLSPVWNRLFLLSVGIQFFYVLGDRVLLRGVHDPRVAVQTISENVRDVIWDGEPQVSDRWMHFPYVPSLRKQEPREVIISASNPEVDLKGLYWGKTFSNKVIVESGYCHWPFTCANGKLEPDTTEHLLSQKPR